MSTDVDKSDDKSLILFGRDVSKIPCFRSSFLYGIGGGLFFGLARFMTTSQTLKSTNFAVYSFSVITIGYWIQCRYNYSKDKFEMMRLQELLKIQSTFEGGSEEKSLDEKLAATLVDV